jgi:hypothetical protein
MPLFKETVRRMLHMLQGMTVWAQHFQVAQIVIFAVSVFVMHTQNFWFGIVATTLAFTYHVTGQHSFSHGRKSWHPNTFSNFINASPRTVFSFFGRRAKKFFAAVKTTIFYAAFAVHSFVVTFCRTILSFVCSARNMRKFRVAFLTVCGNLHSSCQSHTFSAAVLRRIFSIIRHGKQSFAMQTTFFVPNAGASHATH